MVAKLVIGASIALLACRAPAGTIRVGSLDRTYVVHVPATRPAHPALVIALHGSTQNGEALRHSMGGELDALADANGFVVVYPDGFEHNWDDCRKAANFPARAQHIDDDGFVDALIDRAVTDYGVDRERVFAVGYSNGAHMAFRLAFERPDRIAGIAAIAANVPADDNDDCHHSGRAVATMIIDGTDDPLSPYGGGEMFGHRGSVRSTIDSAGSFAALAGLDEPLVTRLPHRDAGDPTWVERTAWVAAGKPEVVLYAIHGGGHVVPQTREPQPPALGRVTHDLDAPAEIWSFFARQSRGFSSQRPADDGARLAP